MKKIRKTDSGILTGGGHNFHRFLEQYSVREWMLIEDYRWAQYHEFESYRWDGPELPSWCHSAEEVRQWIDDQPSGQRMKELLALAGNRLIWEFNAQIGIAPKVEQSPGVFETEYVRNYAVFGTAPITSTPTMRELTWFEEKVAYPYFRFNARVRNVFVGIYNKIVVWNSLTPTQAQKWVESGGTVTTLDYGARQYLYRMIDGQLCLLLPWKKGEWQSEKLAAVPSYFHYYRKVK